MTDREGAGQNAARALLNDLLWVLEEVAAGRIHATPAQLSALRDFKKTAQALAVANR
ncbi:hypothetical protein [Cryobacterium cheniae]|uniref:hypothetical protein n=1 Tax=Cryobacterium cheniae TaxID=1259262 RepID=UPI00141A812F|nr:hypothetical protein [Cryobacterium cheniae]